MSQVTTTTTLTGSDEVSNLMRVNEAIARHGKQAASLMPILQEVQEIYHYLPEEILTYIATALALSPATVYGVATFYAQFSLQPKGKWVIRVCDGTACHVRKSKPVLEAIRNKLGLSEGMQTTGDHRFTVEIVSCLGACGLAPVVVINGQVHGNVTPEAICLILDKIMEQEGGDQA